MSQESNKDVLKNIPSVDKILNWTEIKELENKIEHTYLLSIIRSKTDEFRAKLLEGAKFEIDYLKQMILHEIKYLTEPYFRYAINGLGIVLHTGLGRAPFSQGIADILRDAANAYSRLQIDDEGKRDDRYKKISKLLQILTGCEAGIIVNNNAGATLLILSALAKGKEVIVSRGQLIEIGGSFRIPDIMAQSGCIMREVGTTNRTHLKDYEQAINENTGALLRVHQSNYRVSGFTKEVSLEELVQLGKNLPNGSVEVYPRQKIFVGDEPQRYNLLGKKHNIPVIDDLGSGALIDLSKYGLPKEPMVQESIKIGADIVCFSGDKLIGGPQCGIIIGKKELIEKIKKNPLTRALRCDKLTNAALEATLQMFLHKEEDLIKEHRVMSLLLKPIKEIKSQANGVARKLKKEYSSILDIEVKPAKSEIGGGSLSTEELPTFVVSIKPKNVVGTKRTPLTTSSPSRGEEKGEGEICMTAQELAKLLRQYKIPIFGRVAEDSLLLDFRTILKGEEKIILEAFNNILQ